MIKQQVNVVIIAIQRDAFLAGNKGKTAAEFEQERFHLTQNGGFQILFAVGVPQAQKIQKVWITKNQIGRQRVIFAQSLEFFFNQLLRLFRNGRAFVKHGSNTALQSSRAPSFITAHLSIKVALERVFQISDR